jgi:hypothetical protein
VKDLEECSLGPLKITAMAAGREENNERNPLGFRQGPSTVRVVTVTLNYPTWFYFEFEIIPRTCIIVVV